MPLYTPPSVAAAAAVAAHVAQADPHTQYQKESEKGAPNGYASLDAGGKLPAAQLTTSAMEYKGMWNASTNSPALADGVGDNGDLYRVSVAGTQDLGSGSQDYDVGDEVIYNGSIWEKISSEHSQLLELASTNTPAVVTTDATTTGITITATPYRGAYVFNDLNGVTQVLGDGAKGPAGIDCYFSGDGGTTARLIADIVSGDTLYWNGLTGIPLAVTDRIEIITTA